MVAPVPARPLGFDAQDPDFEARVRTRVLDQPFLRHLGATVTRVRPGHCRIEAPVDPRFAQQNGLVHAGLQATLADSAGGGAAASLMPPGHDTLSAEFKVHLLRPARGIHIVADGYVLRPGRRLTVCEIEVHLVDAEGSSLTLKGTQTLVAVGPDGA